MSQTSDNGPLRVKNTNTNTLGNEMNLSLSVCPSVVLTGGDKSKLSTAIALVGNPPIVLLVSASTSAHNRISAYPNIALHHPLLSQGFCALPLVTVTITTGLLTLLLGTCMYVDVAMSTDHRSVYTLVALCCPMPILISQGCLSTCGSFNPLPTIRNS